MCLLVSYTVLTIADTLDLETRQGVAMVVAKQYRPISKTYEFRYTGDHGQWKPRLEQETFVLILNVAGKTAEFAVSKQAFTEIHERDRIEVRYQVRRLTEEVVVIAIVR